MNIDQLLTRFPLVSEQVSKTEVRIILEQLTKAVNQANSGAVVEFGCYNGTTSLFIQRLLQAADPNQPFHVYDSFEGLPDKTSADISPAGEQFKTGELLARKIEFIHNFKKANLPLPIIHKGWFENLKTTDIPEEVGFAFLDGDYYQSIKQSLRLIASKLASQSIIIVDDYQSEALPGAAKAVDEWLITMPHLQIKVQQSLCIITTR